MGKKDIYWTDVISSKGEYIGWNGYVNLEVPNRMDPYRVQDAFEQNGRIDVNVGHTCGLNALNMANKMLGYSRQWTESTYPYTWVVEPRPWEWFKGNGKIKWGLHSGEFGR